MARDRADLLSDSRRPRCSPHRFRAATLSALWTASALLITLGISLRPAPRDHAAAACSMRNLTELHCQRMAACSARYGALMRADSRYVTLLPQIGSLFNGASSSFFVVSASRKRTSPSCTVQSHSQGASWYASTRRRASDHVQGVRNALNARTEPSLCPRSACVYCLSVLFLIWYLFTV